MGKGRGDFLCTEDVVLTDGVALTVDVMAEEAIITVAQHSFL